MSPVVNKKIVDNALGVGFKTKFIRTHESIKTRL